uniref:Membrane protein BRI3 n=1 Tax=Haemonchus contortus TaxID=6289 RepID=A0A7I4Y3Z6_HAECO
PTAPDRSSSSSPFTLSVWDSAVHSPWMMAASDTTSCPDCHSRTVRWRNTLSGLLWAIFCFPCGIYCCLKRRQQHCSQCDCDVIKSSRDAQTDSFGYSFRGYQTMEKGIPASLAVAYRNSACTASSQSSTGIPEASCNSRTDLIDV